MAPNPPACSFIHASMAGSRSTAPLNRNNSVLIVAPLSAFEIGGYVAPLLFSSKIPRLEQSFLSQEYRSIPDNGRLPPVGAGQRKNRSAKQKRVGEVVDPLDL